MDVLQGYELTLLDVFFDSFMHSRGSCSTQSECLTYQHNRVDDSRVHIIETSLVCNEP